MTDARIRSAVANDADLLREHFAEVRLLPLAVGAILAARPEALGRPFAEGNFVSVVASEHARALVFAWLAIACRAVATTLFGSAKVVVASAILIALAGVTQGIGARLVGTESGQAIGTLAGPDGIADFVISAGNAPPIDEAEAFLTNAYFVLESLVFAARVVGVVDARSR